MAELLIVNNDCDVLYHKRGSGHDIFQWMLTATHTLNFTKLLLNITSCMMTLVMNLLLFSNEDVLML